MTNFEWLLKERKEVVKECMASGGISVSDDNKEDVSPCRYTRCNQCFFRKYEDCTEATNKWLDEEH